MTRNDTYCIIMAGGTGSRFWPMSQAENPKQFLDILNIGQSMLQTTFRRFEAVCPRENIFVVTGKEYVKHVHEQIPGLAPWQVFGEPVLRNTAPSPLRPTSWCPPPTMPSLARRALSPTWSWRWTSPADTTR